MHDIEKRQPGDQGRGEPLSAGAQFPKLAAAIRLQDMALALLNQALTWNTAELYALSPAKRHEIQADAQSIISQRQAKHRVAIIGGMGTRCARLAEALRGDPVGAARSLPRVYNISEPQLYLEITAAQDLDAAEIILSSKERVKLLDSVRGVDHMILILSTAFSLGQNEIVKNYAALRGDRKNRDQIIAIEAQIDLDHALYTQGIESVLSEHGLAPLAYTAKHEDLPAIALRLGGWLDTRLSAAVVIPGITERRT